MRVGSIGNLHIYKNIVGCEEVLLGSHLSNTDRWEGGHAPGTIKSKFFVDTKVIAGGSEMPPSLDCTLRSLKFVIPPARRELNCTKPVLIP